MKTKTKTNSNTNTITKTLLRIDSSARKQGSHSRALADHFQTLWLQANPDGRIVSRDLADTPLPHLLNSTIAAFTAPNDSAPVFPPDAVALSDQLIAELQAADQVLVSSPLYNFNVPSTLKAWVDHVVRFGRTFAMNERGYFGLLRGKSVCIITARGGSDPAPDGLDFQGPYLKSVFAFMGFDRIDVVALAGTAEGNGRLQENIARAREQIADLISGPSDAHVQWLGEFTPQDRKEINNLRARQVDAILRGDATAYAENCTDDILLMLQGFDAVAGRQAFIECESRLFRETKFESMRQIPLRVERHGNVAVEVGRQEITAASGSAAQAEAFKARRKYSHVLRKTPEGWRFAVLMSNNSL
ncbi:MAG TPA: NAD(P)H-dependent oxidoreductase [Verrucomicrobiota bacterium]|nr:NAD(P)H-dependent oxidoreductase [Verrucomicrobiota bacterium]